MAANQKSTKRYFGELIIPPGPSLGKVVISAKTLTKKMGDRVLFENLSFDIERGTVLGIVGPNGSGKTTLLNILAGQDKPDSGQVVVGETVRMGFVSQHREHLDPKQTIVEAISGGHSTVDLGLEQPVPIRQYIAAFSFLGEAQKRLEV
eukprot:TRINITY_DN6651_c0_g1_i1.p1 TRINITY_DN6651_c0_g1~~TRINITY_DN6651_c0_g1_i1.p1  ORF type:complete len:157 (+),score=62.26 TRINITY_DN6651_c0_g1_i1:25-471(+)